MREVELVTPEVFGHLWGESPFITREKTQKGIYFCPILLFSWVLNVPQIPLSCRAQNHDTMVSFFAPGLTQQFWFYFLCVKFIYKQHNLQNNQYKKNHRTVLFISAIQRQVVVIPLNEQLQDVPSNNTKTFSFFSRQHAKTTQTPSKTIILKNKSSTNLW